MKLFNKLAIAAVGAVMALGVGIGLHSNSNGVPARAADTTISSSDVVNNSGYAKYENDDAIITFGGNNVSVGTNSGKRSNCTLSSYGKYAVSPVVSSDIASAFVMKKSLSNIAEITYKFNGGSNQGFTNVYAIYSSDNKTFSQLTLTAGTQGHTISSGTNLKFAKCSGFFGLLFKATNGSGAWRIDNVEITFVEGSAASNKATDIVLDTDYDDDNETTLDGGNTLEEVSTTISYAVNYESGTGDDKANVSVSPTTGASFDVTKNGDSGDVTFTFTKNGDYTATITSTDNSDVSVDIIYHVVNLKEKVLRTFAKVKNNSGLVSGSDYLLVCEDKKAIYDGMNTNYGNQTAVTISNEEITETESMVCLKITSDKDGYVISQGSSNFYYTGSNNALYLGEVSDNTAKWTIDIVDGNATIANVAATTRTIKYNSSSPRFACYTSAQTDVQLYKESSTTPYIELNKSSASLAVTPTETVSNTVDLSVSFFNGATGNVAWTANNDNVTLGTPSDENNKNITITAAKGGTSIVSASVSGFTTMSCEITVTKVLKTLEIVTAPSKTTYNEGESFDPSGIGLRAIYDDNTAIENITHTTPGITWTPKSTLSTSNTYVTINYEEEGYGSASVNQPITVTGRVVDKIEVTKMPNKVSYSKGQTLDTTGIVVTATYVDTSTADVTSSCEFSPTTLNTAGTQEIIVTFGEKTTTFNVTVNDIAGDIANGRYFIADSEGNTLKAGKISGAAGADIVDKVDSVAWNITLIADNTYTIEQSGNYLYSTNTNDGMRTDTTAHNWTITLNTDGSFAMSTHDGTQERHLGVYNSTDFRAYKNTPVDKVDFAIQLVEEKVMYADNFLNSFTSGCNINGGYTSANMDWTKASTQFATLSKDNQNIFKNATYTISGSGSNTVVTPGTGVNTKVAEVVARYDLIVGKYSSFADFMTRGTGASSSRNLVADTSSSLVVTMIAILGLTTLGGAFFFKKRKIA